MLDLSYRVKEWNFIRMSLGSKLKDLRLSKRKSLQEVANSVGASKPHIWELERGTSKNPSLELLKNLAKYYSVTIDFLTDDTSENDRVQAFALSIAEKNLSDSDLLILDNLAKELDKKNRDAN